MVNCKRLQEALEGRGGNYILPFLWMHGEEESVIREEIDRVQSCGIQALCVESRPHPDFAGEAWWRDLDIVMEEARSRGMRVWLLDDDKFPTGHANGAFETKHPELAKLYLAERHVDLLGPAKGNGILIDPFLGVEGKLIAVLAVKKPDTETLAVEGDEVLNLTDAVHEGVAYFDVPAGFWRVFVLFATQKGGGRAHYMNPLDARSVRVLLDEVYEPHYARYKADFGKTFAGFFSDEPEYGNTPGYDFTDRLGKRDLRLPWSRELEEGLRNRWGEGFAAKLPALWYEFGAQTSAIRGGYMELVTRLTEKNFSVQMGNWCAEHGVEYIGHIIEDDNAHGRLGCSLGHYFRAQRGQDMSGIDVVLLQIIPGFTETVHQWIASDRDGEFFHFGLAKLGSSSAHIDPKKQGRAMCEIYGAYGWAEGIGLMRWLTDHMLVRGVNNFVPHGFSPKFPDKDCPPHFFARGNNPQYRFFARLMPYMNRLSHLLSGGQAMADAAVLYHADAEWRGEAMLFQKPVRQLLENQLDCDVIPCDALGGAELSLGGMSLNGNEYRALILPACEHLPRAAAEFARRAAKAGLMIYMVDSLPLDDSDGEPISAGFKEAVTVVPLKELAMRFKEDCGADTSFDQRLPGLRFSRYRHEDGQVLMFFNEHPADCCAVNFTLRLPNAGQLSVTRYDAFENRAAGVDAAYTQGQLSWRIALAPGQAAVYVLSENEALPAPQPLAHIVALNNGWAVSKSAPLEYPTFEPCMMLAPGQELPNMNGPGGFPRFTGTFRYETTFEAPENTARLTLELPQVGDCAEVFLNGEYAGMGIGKPFLFNLAELVRPGKNQLAIEVTNTLVWQMHDGQSTHMQLAPTGLLAPPRLCAALQIP